MGTLTDLLANAGTIIFVSHSLPSVAEFCDRTMWLDHGRVQEVGPSEEVIASYKAEVARQKAEKQA